MADWAKRIQAEMKRRDLTVEEFARAADLSHGTIYSLLAGGKPGALATFRKLFKVGVAKKRDVADALTNTA